VKKLMKEMKSTQNNTVIRVIKFSEYWYLLSIQSLLFSYFCHFISKVNFCLTTNELQILFWSISFFWYFTTHIFYCYSATTSILSISQLRVCFHFWSLHLPENYDEYTEQHRCSFKK
jgi:hypothetical protein